jgi:glycosyltransferase involved in cell wall biosynthesis
VPPPRYGGTELFIAQLASGLTLHGIEPILYANGESESPVEVRSLYQRSHWPLTGALHEVLLDIDHASWAAHDAITDCDLLHVNSASALAFSRFTDKPVVYTVHHSFDAALRDYYGHFPAVHYVCISDHQRSALAIPDSHTIHHGVNLDAYHLPAREDRRYLAFLGRIAPVKGTHLAIQIAQRTSIPLKIAGEVQPMFQSYFDSEVKPHLDGKFIEYIGPVGLAEKNDLLGGALALVFPIQWHEPFGLVMTEAMACGAPVLAMRGGSVDEVVRDGVSGFVCDSVNEMVEAVQQLPLDAAAVRAYVAKHFSQERMVEKYVKLYTKLTDLPASTEVTAAA